MMLSFIIAKEVSHCVILLMLLSISYFHLVCGQQCSKNATIKKCNLDEVLTLTVNNCTKCICRLGFYHHGGLGGCQSCDKCHYPNIIVKECSQMSNTKCGVCKKTYYRTKDGCRKCQKCEHGVLKSCGKDHDTICVLIKMTKVPTTVTHKEEKPTINLKLLTNGSQVHDGSGKDWRRKPIWAILFIISLIIIIVLIVMLCVICHNSSRRLYTPDTASLATSLSSLFLTKSKFPDITCLTEQERGTLICELPGGYAELLAQLLNPDNNWVHLAYQFNLTLIRIANLKTSSECTQDLLLYLCSINTTVEMLLKGLKNIKRDDACIRVMNFILDLRKDNESAILLIN